ncbi:hypothetical protein M5689_003815 [Euphorbia peplus]|nr:hypothetical protein M5689_003815 [Euphorbia peplus]
MFVHVWTNNVLHIGNSTTCRVEAAHAALKKWLHSATCGLDTIFVKIDDKIEAELASTREILEQSNQRSMVSYFGFAVQQFGMSCFRLLYEIDWK